MNRKGFSEPSFVLGFLIGGLMVIIIIGFSTGYSNAPSDETLADICKNLTAGNSTEGYIDHSGKLVCEVPTYDHTTNIIVRGAGEE